MFRERDRPVVDRLRAPLLGIHHGCFPSHLVNFLIPSWLFKTNAGSTGVDLRSSLQALCKYRKGLCLSFCFF